MVLLAGRRVSAGSPSPKELTNREVLAVVARGRAERQRARCVALPGREPSCRRHISRLRRRPVELLDRMEDEGKTLAELWGARTGTSVRHAQGG
jgi:hypothetical protein